LPEKPELLGPVPRWPKFHLDSASHLLAIASYGCKQLYPPANSSSSLTFSCYLLVSPSAWSSWTTPWSTQGTRQSTSIWRHADELIYSLH
jgi:hypothetical protein